MSRLDELIKEKCPNGVEYVSLRDVAIALPKGTLKTSELITDGEYPVMNSGRSYYGRYSNYNNEDAITIAARGEYAGFVNYNSGKFWAGGLCYPYKSKDESKYSTKFIFYALKNKQEYVRETLVAKGSIPALNKQDIDKFRIPMPPIEIQQEIVGMLNSFTELEAELEAELTKRKQQYEHYRDHLLSFENIAGEVAQVEWLPLEDVAKIKNGSGYKDFGVGPYPVYGTGGIMTRVDKYAYDKPSVLIPRKGSLDRVYYVEEPFWNVDTIFYTVIDERKIKPKYFYYFLSSKHLEELNQAAGIPSLTQATLNKIKIPVPSLKIQERIVYVLDNFDTVCNDLKIGLPAEIEARQKQYEYYRDRLLSFDAVVGGGTEREREE